MFPIPTFHTKIFISANLGPTNFGLKLEKSNKICWSKNGWNENFVMQSGYWEQTLCYDFFSFIIENKTESKFSPRSRSKKLLKFCKATPILSCYSILNWIENYNMHEINLFLSTSKNISCAKSIYFWSELFLYCLSSSKRNLQIYCVIKPYFSDPNWKFQKFISKG